jgi:hypothetical protein
MKRKWIKMQYFETIEPLEFNELQNHENFVIIRNCMILIHLYEPIYMKYMILEV